MAKNTKKNAEVVVEETKKKVTKKTAEKPVEKSTKKTSAKTAEKKTSEKKPVEKAVKIAKKTKATEKPVAEKKTTKKAEKPEKVSKIDKMFPKTLDIEGEEIIRSDVNTWDSLKKLFDEATEAGKSVFFAVYWPKKFKKEYEGSFAVKFPKNGFENDLDVVEVQFFQQTYERCLVVSLYTEAISITSMEDLSVDEETGITFIGQAEAGIYVSK